MERLVYSWLLKISKSCPMKITLISHGGVSTGLMIDATADHVNT